MARRTKRGRRPFHSGRHKPSEHRDLPPALPPTTGGRPLSVTEDVYLPNGADSSLAEVASALLNVAHDDLIRRPALLIVQADRILEAVERCRTFTDLEQCLSCANSTITSLFNAAVNMGKKPVSRALLNANDIQEAVLQLHRDLHDTLLGIELPVCPWQRKLPDMLPPVEPSAQSGNPMTKAYHVLRAKPAGSLTVPRPSDDQVQDPRRGAVSHSLAHVLPKNLKSMSQSDTAKLDVAIRRLQETTFQCDFGSPLPAHFTVAEWRVDLFFFLDLHAAAQKVAGLLQELEDLHVNHQQQNHAAQAASSDSVQAQIDALRAGMAAVKAGMKAEKLDHAVNAAKNAYCAALMTALGFPMTMRGMTQVTFTANTASQPADGAGKKIEFERPETHGSGGCPLRAALLAGAAAAGGHDVACPELPPVEAKAHIIPLAAANCLETAILLHKIDSMPDHLNTPVGDFLALSHNVFYLSSCFESFFDSGALVFVKIGPPECQFYRVTTTKKAEAAVIDFGVDIQMEKLFAHIEAPVPLSCIDGLVVDLARPARVISRDGVEHGVAPVNQRYLELHAEAHNPPSIGGSPALGWLCSPHTLWATALWDAESDDAEESDDDHRLTMTEAWLDDVAPLPEQPES